ncbi:hypothetical protein KQX54_000097 [Cotesia glomerata]|uniref:Aminomethyltransferase, mitochondrial n=1 Tax=Cotesia glomerata TaxID=32391 RepID=A0AAV7I097_COTGL|nr:hypothetical protein KQX54_000097 [Cotesia glomerata]
MTSEYQNTAQIDNNKKRGEFIALAVYYLNTHEINMQRKIVDFAGWLLPVQYKGAIAVSHQHTRTQASLFDVGHMLQTIVWGRNSGEFLESLTTADLKNLKPGGSTLTVFTNDQGGILDDLIITKDAEDRFYVVSNAGRRDCDINLFNQRKVVSNETSSLKVPLIIPHFI